MKFKLKLILIVVLIISASLIYAAQFGVDFVTGNGNEYSLSGYNLLMKLDAKSKLYPITNSQNEREIARTSRNMLINVTRKNTTSTTTSQFQILSISNSVE